MTVAPGPASRPWVVKELRKLIWTLAFSAIALGVSWVGVSGTIVWSRQILWTVVGIAAIAMSGVAITSWLSAGFRDVRIRQSTIAEALAARLGPAPNQTSDPVASNRLVSVAGMAHYHFPDCLLVRGKQLTPVASPAEQELRPCGACILGSPDA